MSNEQFDKIIDKLDTLAKILAVNVLKEKNQTERIILLAELGFENKTIANLLGIKENVVRATKSKAAKSAQRPKASRKVKPKEEDSEKKVEP
jgi:hypothetical protein